MKLFSPCAAAALYQRSALRELGGLMKTIFAIWRMDLGVLLMGGSCLYVAAIRLRITLVRVRPGQHSDFAVYHGHRNLVVNFSEEYARRTVLAAFAGCVR